MRGVAGWGNGPSARAARVWAGALAIAFLTIGAVNRDGEALVFGALSLLAGQLTRVRKGTIGRVALALLAIDTAAWMAPATFVNARDGGAVLAPAALAVLSIGILALVLAMPPMPVLAGGLVLLAGAVVLSIVRTGTGSGTRSAVAAGTKGADAAFLRARNAAFDRKVVEVRSGDALTVRNDDLFWHTFTVPDLHIDARLATRATRSIALDLPPGSYRFVCAIPGHDQAGMHGTLIIR
jgi:plastocyanin